MGIETFTWHRPQCYAGANMNPPIHQVRRVTLDDVKALAALWQVAGLPVLELERHFTEFQVVARTDGPLIGAIGLHIHGTYGKLHNEAFFHPEQEDEFRPLLWERVQTVARNHGLTRLWTQEEGVFWHQQGFEDANDELKQKFPASFGDVHGHWRTLQLRDEAAITRSLEQEFELLRLSQQEQNERMMRQARALKLVATLIAVVLFAIVSAGLIYLFKQGRFSGGK